MLLSFLAGGNRRSKNIQANRDAGGCWLLEIGILPAGTRVPATGCKASTFRSAIRRESRIAGLGRKMAVSGWAEVEIEEKDSTTISMERQTNWRCRNAFSAGVALGNALILAQTGCYCKFNIEVQPCFCIFFPAVIAAGKKIQATRFAGGC